MLLQIKFKKMYIFLTFFVFYKLYTKKSKTSSSIRRMAIEQEKMYIVNKFDPHK